MNIGDVIRVEIKKSRFQTNDESILSVGMFVNNTGNKVEVDESVAETSDETNLRFEENE